MTTNIRTDRAGAVATITIDRQARFNALDVRTAQDFRRAGLRCARDETVRAVIVRGLPGVFCSGADLKFIRDGGDQEDLTYLTPSAVGRSTVAPGTVAPGTVAPGTVAPGTVAPGTVAPGTVAPGTLAPYAASFKQILEYIHSAISEIRRAPKPFVAAVDGIAAAGGFGIAMACDLVIASSRATFEWAYGKTGLTGAESSTFLLPRLIGLRRSMELMLLNPRLSAHQALQYGLITAVYDVDDFDDQVRAIGERLAAGPPRAYAVAKELLNQSAGMDRLDDHLDRELQELARAANGPEVAEGMAAFLGKRKAVFVTAEDAEDAESRVGPVGQVRQVGQDCSPPALPARPATPGL